MGIVRDLYYARKMSAGLKLPAPTVALLIKRLTLAAAMGGDVTKTVSGTMVHITDALAKAALSVLVDIEPVQDLHGYDSPWPAGGGKNGLLPLESNYSSTLNGITITYNSETEAFSLSGTNTKTDSAWLLPQSNTYTFRPLSSETTYYFAHNLPSGVYGQITYNKTGGGVAVLAYLNGNGSFNKVSFTLPANFDSIARVQVGVNTSVTTVSASGIHFGVYAENPTEWSPYSNICPISGWTGANVYVSPTQDQQDATTYAVDWTTEAGTVYGGTLDVTNGVLTVDRACTNLSTSWYWYVGSTQPTGKTVVSTTGFPEHNGTAAICSHYKHSNTIYVVGLQLGEFLVSNGGKGAYFCFKNESGGTAQEFKDIITAQETAGTPIQVCYELATPITYQLTPQEVQMLLGENNVWSSSGDTVSVTYYAEGNANALQSLNILLGGNYSNPKTSEDVSDKEALEIILGGNK